MAPMKRTHELSSKNRDKTKRRKYTNDANMLYKCLGKLCGEECEQDLIPVADNMSRRSRDSADEMEMDACTDISDDDDFDDRQMRSTTLSKGINQLKSKKKTDLTLKLGMQRARRYICEALDFGVQSGYLTMKDSKGQLLKVSSDLLQGVDQNKIYDSKRVSANEADTSSDRRLMRKRQYDSVEKKNDKNPVTEARRPKSTKKRRSQSNRTSMRRSGKTRSRSKRKHGKKRMGRSHSNNPEPETRPKQAKIEEQDSLDPNNKSANTINEGNEEDNDDCKSIKSAKSDKSNPGSDSQNSSDKKKHGENDASNDEISDDDDDKKK